MRQRSQAGLLAALLVTLALLGAGCSEPTAEAKLRAAEQELEAAKSHLEQQRQELERRRKAFEAAQSSLAKAREAVAKAETRVTEAEQAVRVHATDDVLFRTVQTRLLEERALRDAAIRAVVQDGVVTLEGEAPDGRTRDRAVDLVREIPGVRDVRERIRLSQPEPPKPATAK
jgi:osmotically-inducible protein OsmY